MVVQSMAEQSDEKITHLTVDDDVPFKNGPNLRRKSCELAEGVLCFRRYAGGTG